MSLVENYLMGSPSGSDSKESACNVGDLGSGLRLGRSLGGGHGNQLQYTCLESPYGQRSLMGSQKSDMTEQLSTFNDNKVKVIIFVLYDN